MDQWHPTLWSLRIDRRFCCIVVVVVGIIVIWIDTFYLVRIVFVIIRRRRCCCCCGHRVDLWIRVDTLAGSRPHDENERNP